MEIMRQGTEGAVLELGESLGQQQARKQDFSFIATRKWILSIINELGRGPPRSKQPQPKLTL
jgi:hypothetical protein